MAEEKLLSKEEYMGLYEFLQAEKERGKKLDFDQINCDDLKQLFYDEKISDTRISELFGVTPSKVRYKRNKFKITLRSLILNDALKSKNIWNDEAKNRLMKIDKVDAISKALTHFAFRNGPIEDMHAGGQLTQSNMKTLNKFMVNRLAYVISLIISDRWLELEFLIESYRLYGVDWDKAEPDDGGNIEIIKMYLKR
jgi:hypothetical protein